MKSFRLYRPEYPHCVGRTCFYYSVINLLIVPVSILLLNFGHYRKCREC